MLKIVYWTKEKDLLKVRNFGSWKYIYFRWTISFFCLLTSLMILTQRNSTIYIRQCIHAELLFLDIISEFKSKRKSIFFNGSIIFLFLRSNYKTDYFDIDSYITYLKPSRRHIYIYESLGATLILPVCKQHCTQKHWRVLFIVFNL